LISPPRLLKIRISDHKLTEIDVCALLLYQLVKFN
jgi:hypothetical protein